MASPSGPGKPGLAAVSGEIAPAAPPAAPPVRMDPALAAARAQFLDVVAREPHHFDFYQVMRRLEFLSREMPRMGTAARPADEPIRLGQEPSMAFQPAMLTGLFASRIGGVPRMRQSFFGLLGPNGPLPLHLTEFAADRARSANDPTLGRFLDIFHHRLLLVFYRAWATAQPTADRDRPGAARFETYVGATLGLVSPAMQRRDALPDSAKLYYAGRFSARAHNAEGLEAMIADFFAMPTKIEQFSGDWIDIPPEQRWFLGSQQRRLGESSVLGARIFSRAHKFRVVLGPLTRAQFQKMLPGRPSLARLTAMVRNYVGDSLAWDLKLSLFDVKQEPLLLGTSRLGWTSWLGIKAGGVRQDLILNPELGTETVPIPVPEPEPVPAFIERRAQ
jgi:type VI secretion system protein ImpH